MATLTTLPTGSQDTLGDCAGSFEIALRAESRVRAPSRRTSRRSQPSRDFCAAKIERSRWAGFAERTLPPSWSIGSPPARRPLPRSSFGPCSSSGKWALSDDLVVASPMERMTGPLVVVDPPKVLRSEELTRLLKA